MGKKVQIILPDKKVQAALAIRGGYVPTKSREYQNRQ